MALAEADLNMTRNAMDAGSNRSTGDENLLVRFFLQPKENQTKSREAGRPIFEEREYIQIIQPGNKENIVIRPASEMDINRFPEHYRKWKARASDDEYVEGTLLAHWPGVTRSQVEELRYMKIMTVEQLAAVSDANAQGMLGINLLRTRAQEYLAASETQKTADEMHALRTQNEQMMAQMQKMQAQLEAQVEAQAQTEDAPAPRRRRGRPPAAETKDDAQDG